MATASIMTSAESTANTNYTRLGLAAQQELPNILREYLRVKEPTHMLHIHALVDPCLSKKLRPNEWALIGKSQTHNYNDFDIPLMYKMIRNMKLAPPPTKGWDHPVDPTQNEITIGDDIERIRRTRNKILHRSNTHVEEVELHNYMTLFKEIAERMESYLNKPKGEFVSKLEVLESCCMDQKTQDIYFEKLKALKEDDREAKSELLSLNKEVAQLKKREEKREYLKHNYDYIVRNTDLEESVLDTLISACVLTIDDGLFITKASKKEDRNKILLDILSKRPYDTDGIIREALLLSTKDENNKLDNVDELVGTIKIMDTQVDHKDIMIDRLSIKVQKNIDRLVRIPSFEIVIGCLISMEVLTFAEYKDIKNERPSDRNRLLVFKIWSKGSDACQKFIDALKSDSDLIEIADTIQDTLVTDFDVQLIQIGISLSADDNDAVPPHIQEHMRRNIKDWIATNKHFVATRASAFVLKCLKTRGCVTLTGSAGVGKTMTMRHVALNMLREGFFLAPILLPSDLRDYYQPGKKVLFLVDDFCGNYTPNQQQLDQWIHVLEQIRYVLQDNACKILVTCRFQVFKDVRLSALPLFKLCECNMLSENLCLTANEKRAISDMYLENNAWKVTNLGNDCDFFPLVCRLCRDKDVSDIESFFKQPFVVYQKELDSLWQHGDEGKQKLCALALFVMHNNLMPQSSLMSGDTKTKKMIEDVCEACELDMGTSKRKLMNALDTLDGTFVKKHDGNYKAVHDKLFDFLACYFGKWLITEFIDHAHSGFIRERFVWRPRNEDFKEDGEVIDFILDLPDGYLQIYISRLIADWSESNLVDVFANRNMQSILFRKKLLAMLRNLDESKQKEFANTIDKKTEDQPILLTCFYDDVGLLKWILEFNSNFDVRRKNSYTPLLIASEKGYNEVVRLLLNAGADVNMCTDDGGSPLCIASVFNKVNVMQSLIENNADINKGNEQGMTPLYIACFHGNSEAAHVLLEHQADINICNIYGQSPFNMACLSGVTEIVCSLINIGAEIHKGEHTGATALFNACQDAHLEVVLKLLEHKANVNARIFTSGMSPLFIASVSGNVKIVQALLEHGADVNCCVVNEYVMTMGLKQYDIVTLFDYMLRSMEYLKGKGSQQFKHYLKRQNGVDRIQKAYIGSSPLHMASCLGYLDIVKLLSTISNIDKQNENQATPLFLSCEDGNVSVAKHLIKCGADINLTTKDGKSPLDIATENEHMDIVSLIKTIKKTKTLCQLL